MADTVNIGGKPINKNLVIGGVGVVMVAGVFYYRKNKATAANQASVDAAGSSSIDPATGYSYGSAEDAAALSAQGNYQNPIQGAYGFAGYGGGASATFGSGAPGSFANNAEWAQFVENYEINNMGADGPSVGNAIGKYISGQPLTTDAMVSIIQSAIAIGGYPPTSGPNGHPPGYVTSLPSSTIPSPATTKAGAISGLTATKSGTTATFRWNATSAPQGYAWNIRQINGVTVKSGSGQSTWVVIPNLHKGWSYHFNVQALPHGPGKTVNVSIAK